MKGNPLRILIGTFIGIIGASIVWVGIVIDGRKDTSYGIKRNWFTKNLN